MARATGELQEQFEVDSETMMWLVGRKKTEFYRDRAKFRNKRTCPRHAVYDVREVFAWYLRDAGIVDAVTAEQMELAKVRLIEAQTRRHEAANSRLRAELLHTDEVSQGLLALFAEVVAVLSSKSTRLTREIRLCATDEEAVAIHDEYIREQLAQLTSQLESLAQDPSSLFTDDKTTAESFDGDVGGSRAEGAAH